MVIASEPDRSLKASVTGSHRAAGHVEHVVEQRIGVAVQGQADVAVGEHAVQQVRRALQRGGGDVGVAARAQRDHRECQRRRQREQAQQPRAPLRLPAGAQPAEQRRALRHGGRREGHAGRSTGSGSSDRTAPGRRRSRSPTARRALISGTVSVRLASTSASRLRRRRNGMTIVASSSTSAQQPENPRRVGERRRPRPARPATCSLGRRGLPRAHRPRRRARLPAR